MSTKDLILQWYKRLEGSCKSCFKKEQKKKPKTKQGKEGCCLGSTVKPLWLLHNPLQHITCALAALRTSTPSQWMLFFSSTFSCYLTPPVLNSDSPRSRSSIPTLASSLHPYCWMVWLDREEVERRRSAGIIAVWTTRMDLYAIVKGCADPPSTYGTAAPAAQVFWGHRSSWWPADFYLFQIQSWLSVHLWWTLRKWNLFFKKKEEASGCLCLLF